MLIKLHIAMVQLLEDLKSRESGQGMVEYGIILALIALVVFAALGPLGSKVSSLISSVTSGI